MSKRYGFIYVDRMIMAKEASQEHARKASDGMQSDQDAGAVIKKITIKAP